MKRLSLLGLAFFASAACAPANTTPATTPTPVPAPVERPAAPAAMPAAPPPMMALTTTLKEAPTNWQLLDEGADQVPGISVLRAQRELLAGKQPKRTVVVAVIDGGVDTAQLSLRPNLWANPKEIPGNGKDDDHNGYVDDVRGWNFIGGPDGRDVDHDTFELTRMYARCMAGAQAVAAIPMPSVEQCKDISEEYAKKSNDANASYKNVKLASDALTHAIDILTPLVQGALTQQRVTALHPTSFEGQQARAIYLQLAQQGATPAVVADALQETESQVKYSLDPAFDPRSIVGDNYADVTQRIYGNNDVTGPDAKHGTHVSGIIGAVKNTEVGIEGIAPAVRIMAVRAVPDGDERDKDIANAIRYAVDEGASVINMSFGKEFSPFKAAVDDAVKYADAHGVLMVHAAGNDGADNDTAKNYPTPYYLNGARAQLWIEVGASSWKGGDSLATSFSNYGATHVDVFAPGDDILSTIPGNKYERDSGTSMASPVVTGLAALIMAYYPNLSPATVKQIILNSTTRYTNRVVRPGSTTGEMVPFSSLSVSGGVVNAYNAVKMAEQMSAH